MENLILLFRGWQKEHPNFVTPNIIKLKQVNNFVVELSSGRGFEQGTTMYGVSVIEYKNSVFKSSTTNLGKSFPSRREADRHFDKVVKILRKRKS